MCLMAIPEDNSFLDARGSPLTGFGEIIKADDHIMKDQVVVSGVALGLTFLAYLLKMIFICREEKTNSKVSPRPKAPKAP